MDALYSNGTSPFNLLYIDDELDKITFMKGIFSPEGIEKYLRDSTTLKFKADHLCEHIDALTDESKVKLCVAINELLGDDLQTPLDKENVAGARKLLSEAISKRCPDEEFPTVDEKFQQFLHLLEQHMGPEYPLKKYDSKAAVALSDSKLALLQRVELHTVLNNPTEADLAQDDTVPTPASLAARDIYEGKYDLVVSDLNMPLDSEGNKQKYSDGGGYFIANIAKIAGVPLIVHSYTSRENVIKGLKQKSPNAIAYQQEPSQERVQFSEAIRTPRKLNQRQVFEAVAAELEKLIQPPELAVA